MEIRGVLVRAKNSVKFWEKALEFYLSLFQTILLHIGILAGMNHNIDFMLKSVFNTIMGLYVFEMSEHCK